MYWSNSLIFTSTHHYTAVDQMQIFSLDMFTNVGIFISLEEIINKRTHEHIAYIHIYARVIATDLAQ